MPANAAAENALGTLGTICWTIQLVPQIWKTWRDKSTEGLSMFLVFLWGASAGPMGVYAIVLDLNIPLILQPQLFGALCFFSWAQCMYYGKKRSVAACVAMYFGALVILAAFQAGMVYAIRPSYKRGNGTGAEFFGILSSVIIAVALLPQYWEIYKRREVVGISVLFMTVDMMGGVFSDLSLAFKSSFNIIAGVTYSLVVVMDGLVILLALILNPLTKRRRKRAEAATASSANVVPPSTNDMHEGGPTDIELASNDPPSPSAHADVERKTLNGEKDIEHRQFEEV
ncbi:PQ-loop-domain-containing protein [Wolfiporia cocos MD-104 SS10]|uniref:PQ-loop-domain-containing protein n=1 Tax=Wolfiporia cocos (strain MD-104) TaxID=742152 RepID=A0A2H3JWS3_WOLCO|nr:PQ-loop-domain-containing protein [Wolfiporia cocos MD-104 SS10]